MLVLTFLGHGLVRSLSVCVLQFSAARLELGDSRPYAGLSRVPFAHVALLLSLEAPTLLHYAAGLRFDLRRMHNTYAVFIVYVA